MEQSKIKMLQNITLQMTSKLYNMNSYILI